mmetsp:Transcript_22390/g.50455  ORF Transcript_22390/g.50455 Transcript_22390/m.50455 type:complete len:301 (+) Transcript_22390:2342-3244(+)
MACWKLCDSDVSLPLPRYPRQTLVSAPGRGFVQQVLEKSETRVRRLDAASAARELCGFTPVVGGGGVVMLRVNPSDRSSHPWHPHHARSSRHTSLSLHARKPWRSLCTPRSDISCFSLLSRPSILSPQSHSARRSIFAIWSCTSVHSCFASVARGASSSFAPCLPFWSRRPLTSLRAGRSRRSCSKHFHQVLDVVVQPLDFVVHVLVLRRHHPLRSNEMLLQLRLIPLSIVRVGRLVGIGIGQRTCCSLLVSHDYCGKCGQSEREADKDSQGTRPSWLTRLKTHGGQSDSVNPLFRHVPI